MTVLEFFSSNKDAFIAISVFLTALAAVIGVFWNSRASKIEAKKQTNQIWADRLQDSICKIIQLEAKSFTHLKGSGKIDTNEFATIFSEQNYLYNFIRIHVGQVEDGEQLSKLIHKLILGTKTEHDTACLDEIVKLAHKIIKDRQKS